VNRDGAVLGLSPGAEMFGRGSTPRKRRNVLCPPRKSAGGCSASLPVERTYFPRLVAACRDCHAEGGAHDHNCSWTSAILCHGGRSAFRHPPTTWVRGKSTYFVPRYRPATREPAGAAGRSMRGSEYRIAFA